MRSLLVLFTLVCVFATTPIADAQEVIAHPGVKQQSISRNALRAIFGMRLHKWPDGTPIKVFVLSDSTPLHIKFCKKILNVFPHQLRRAWDRLVYSGTGQSPVEVASEREMRQKVTNIPGAIGYLLTKKEGADVSILQVR